MPAPADISLSDSSRVHLYQLVSTAIVTKYDRVALAHPAIVDPDELGAALAIQCFSQAQLPLDGKLGIDGE